MTQFAQRVIELLISPSCGDTLNRVVLEFIGFEYFLHIFFAGFTYHEGNAA